MYFRSYTCLTEHIVVLRILYGAYSGTKVPVGTTELIHILLIRKYP